MASRATNTTRTQSKLPVRQQAQQSRRPRRRQQKKADGPGVIPTDVRLPRNDVPKAGIIKNLVQGTDTSITVRADLAGLDSVPVGFQSLALGIVLTSLSRGWSGQLAADQKDYPYNAYVYLVQSFISASQGTTSTITVAPTWYWYILDAIAPTTVKYKTGNVDYSWTNPVVGTYVPPPSVISAELDVLLGWVNTSGVDVNGFYPIVPGVYDATIADKALQSLFNLYSEDGPMLKRIPRKVTPMQMDVSAFTSSYPEMGGSLSSPGGMATSLQSEVFIDCPLLAKFAYYNDQDFRGVTHVARSSGTPCYVIPRMMEFKSSGVIKNKVPPIFKFYNFDEFFEVLSLTLGRALEITASNNAQTPVGPCPLSPQAVQILLRQSMIPRFCNHMAQDLTLSGTFTQPLTPFSVGSNGVSITAASFPLKLPQLLAENIRACERRLTYLQNNDHQSDMVPILSRPYNLSQLGNYKTSVGGLVYTDMPGETPIDLISLSAVTPSGTVYLDANGGYIQGLANKFNEWITTLGSALSPLTNHAEEDGIRALSTIVNTLHVTQSYIPDAGPVAVNSKTLVKKNSIASIGKKIDVSRRLGAGVTPTFLNYTQEYAPVAFTSTYAPQAAVYKYLKIMILPTFMLRGDNEQNNIGLQQVNQIEPFRINETTVSDETRTSSGLSLFDRHAMFAEQEVRTNLAPSTEFQTELDQLTRAGRGGFFTDIAGIIAGDVFKIPGAKQIASTIGQITGL
jgi:hypothetical protein